MGQRRAATAKNGMYYILLGAPGAGKGTQGSLLAERLGIPKIATGDILRQAVLEGTPLGQEARRFMDAGELVPDEVILGLVREALASETAREGAIFDGFPRTVHQAKALDELLADANRQIDAVVVLEVPTEAIVERMSGRRTDPVTNEVYHVRHNPPPAAVADRVVQRPDDREETVRRRLERYRESTEPLIDFYRTQGVPLHTIDADRPIDEVAAAVQQAIGR